MVILPTVAQVAADDPDTAAKIAQPITFVCSSLPGKRFSHGANPLNRSSDSRVRNRISPIHRNKGRAVSVQLDDAPQMVTAMASPAGRLEKISMPIQAVPASVRPTQTPQPKSAKIETTNRVMTRSSFMGLLRSSGGHAA
ncbi:hypothetical protein D3C73_926150 [compost metagenome]